MSEKSKGDTSAQPTSRIVKNPLLSANITNLTFDDFSNKPVLLPAAPPIIPSFGSGEPQPSTRGKGPVTVGQAPDIDTDTLSEISLNTTDDGPRPQSDLNDNPFPQIQHEPSAHIPGEFADDSILSQAASSFSQLPTVASTVLSTFSKVINNYSPASRETSTDRDINLNAADPQLIPSQQHQQQQQQPQQIPGLEQFSGSGFNNQYLNQPTATAPRLLTPPSIGTDLTGNQLQPISSSQAPNLPPPLTAGGNTYRLSSKKKTYAQIPGLSVHTNNPLTAVDDNPNKLPNQEVPSSSVSPVQLQSQPTQPPTFDSYSSGSYSQPKIEESKRSNNLFSGVIQNISGFVKSTVVGETEIKPEINPSNIGFYIQDPPIQGYVASNTSVDISINQQASNTLTPPLTRSPDQIGFETVQASIETNLNQQLPQGLPPIKPPTTAPPSSYRLQKGTRLYKASALPGEPQSQPQQQFQTVPFFNPLGQQPGDNRPPSTERQQEIQHGQVSLFTPFDPQPQNINQNQIPQQVPLLNPLNLPVAEQNRPPSVKTPQQEYNPQPRDNTSPQILNPIFQTPVQPYQLGSPPLKTPVQPYPTVSPPLQTAVQFYPAVSSPVPNYPPPPPTIAFVGKPENKNQFDSVPVLPPSLEQKPVEPFLVQQPQLHLQENFNTTQQVHFPIPPSNSFSAPEGVNPFRRESTKSSHSAVTSPSPPASSVSPLFTPSTTSPPPNSVNPVNHQLATAAFYTPHSTDEWAQQIINEATQNVNTANNLNNNNQKITLGNLEPEEPFPEKFDLSTVLSQQPFKYLPPSIKSKQPENNSYPRQHPNIPITSGSDLNTSPPLLPPAPILPSAHQVNPIDHQSAIASFYNPTSTDEWAKQIINAADQGLQEIPSEILDKHNIDSRNLETNKNQGNLELEEPFPEKFDFSSIGLNKEQQLKYLPPAIDKKASNEPPNFPIETLKILKIEKETVPEGTPKSFGEFLTNTSLSTSGITQKDLQQNDKYNTDQQIRNSNLANYFGQQQQEFDNLTTNQLNNLNNVSQTDSHQLIKKFDNISITTQNTVLPTSNVTTIQSTPGSAPTLLNFFNIQTSNEDKTCAQQISPPTVAVSLTEISSVDNNLNKNISEKSTPEKAQQPNLFLNYFQSNQLPNKNEILVNKQQSQSQIQQASSTVSFFDQISNQSANSSSSEIAAITVSTTESQQSEDPNSQRIQNFFNNPPPQNLTEDSVNSLNFKNLYGCGGLKQKTIVSDLLSTTGHSDNRSVTPASNIVEPPSSACSEFSNDFNTTISSTQQSQDQEEDIKNSYFNQIPNELIEEHNKMANLIGIGANTSTQSNVVYQPVQKHWFFKKTELSKQIWTPFSHKDSEALEQSYIDKGPQIIAVEGGRYDVNIEEKTRTPVYWTGEPTEVRRCSWFYKSIESKYVPYEEETADILEEEYRNASNSGEWRKKISLSSGETVVFHGPTVLVHFLKSQSSDAWGGATQSSPRPRVVKRDLDDFIIDAGETNKVDHLVFMVHGIGSACDLKFRCVEEVVDEFRSIAYQLVQAHYKNSVDNGDVGRVEVLPVSWHDELHSTESGIDQKIKAITLESIPKLRNFSNDTVLDVLFYTSPVYCQYIINTVAGCMNRVYLKYCQRNTDFSGQVSLAGHSLGSLILFDLLCHQKPIEDSDMNSENPDQIITPQISHISHQPHSQQVSYTVGSAGTGQPFISYPQLLFAPRKFFALGSPIGMFVTIRGIDTLGLDFKLPTCSGFYNIFHPYDPVAYRMEALVNPDLSTARPVLISHHKGRKRMHLELKETMTRVGAEVKQRIADVFKGTMESVFFLTSKNKVEDQQEMEKEVDKVLDMQLKLDQSIIRPRTLSNSSTAQSDPDIPDIDIPLGKLNESKRIDYVLQEAPLEFFNEYLFALTSHVCYWESEDTILFVVKEIYSSMGTSTDATVPQQNMTIERPNSRGSFSLSPS